MMKLISEQCYNQDQSWNYEKIIEDSGHKLKINIRRNAYDNQSHAKVERWSGSEWKFVFGRPIIACHCQIRSYVDKGVRADDSIRMPWNYLRPPEKS